MLLLTPLSTHRPSLSQISDTCPFAGYAVTIGDGGGAGAI